MIRVFAFLLLASASLAAQVPLGVPTAQQMSCAYEQCGLGIAPAWNGLDVVHGTAGTRVAGLGFFLPRDITAVFAGSDSAKAYAVRAVAVRRVAAGFTDAGALLLAYAAARQLGSGRLNRTDRVVGAIGAASFTIAVPLQFSADGLLSRAVWWHNARFAGRTLR